MDKRYDFKRAEKELEKMWEENEIYKYQYGRKGKVFSYTQAEIIARFKRMQGFDVFYPFGFDDNGLPTERLVEKELQMQSAIGLQTVNSERILFLIRRN